MEAYIVALEKEYRFYKRLSKKSLKKIKLLNAALDKLISDSVMPHDDPDKIAAFKEGLLNQVKEGRG